jgi:hypothetical protein
MCKRASSVESMKGGSMGRGERERERGEERVK